MSSYLLLLVALAALTISCHAQQEYCGAPYPSISSRLPRQAVPSTPNAPQTATASVPYSRCGAVVISDRFLLSSATCVLLNSVNSVRLGDLDLSKDGEVNSRPADYDIGSIYVHPNFTYNRKASIHYSDLALLKTKRKIEFNEAVFPYCLSQQRLAPGVTVIGSGFGFVNETHKATHLQEGEIDVISQAECEAAYRAEGKLNLVRRAYPGLLQGSGVICTRHPTRGICRGDEGGPLMREDDSGRRFLEGIISFTDDKCVPGMLPSISVSIADHYNYIMDIIQHPEIPDITH